MASSSEFGSKLRQARERKGVSLREIATKTKISVSALEALERGDISRLPGGIFSRAFVRSYAVEVGLNPDRTVQEFIEQFPHDSVTAGTPLSSQADDNEAIESDRRVAETLLKLLLISVPIAGALIYFGASGRRQGSTSTPTEPPAEVAAGVPVSRKPAAAVPAATSAAPPPADRTPPPPALPPATTTSAPPATSTRTTTSRRTTTTTAAPTTTTAEPPPPTTTTEPPPPTTTTEPPPTTTTTTEPPPPTTTTTTTTTTPEAPVKIPGPGPRVKS